MNFLFTIFISRFTAHLSHFPIHLHYYHKETGITLKLQLFQYYFLFPYHFQKLLTFLRNLFSKLVKFQQFQEISRNKILLVKLFPLFGTIAGFISIIIKNDLAMDYQRAYYAAAKLLKQRGFTQKTISRRLREMEINGYSEGNLSRAKPQYDYKKKKWRRGALSDGQLRELMKGMVKLLSEKGVAMKVEAEEPIFYDVNTEEKYDMPPLQYEEDVAANLTTPATEAPAEEKLIEQLKAAKQIQLLQAALLTEGPLAEALAKYIENGGQIEIVLINLNGNGK